MTKVICGIDFGLKESCVAIAKKVSENKTDYSAIENRLGKQQTPSYVFFDDDEIIVGQTAKNQSSLNPEGAIYDVKNLLGKKFSDPEIKNYIKNVPYKIIPDDENNILIEVKNQNKTQKFYPEQIVAIILNELIENIKNRKGKYPDECVITCPAYFNDEQRIALKHAAELAKLPVVRIINELTAAVAAFQHYDDKDKYCPFTEHPNIEKGIALVYEFGEGVSSASIVEFEGNNFTILSNTIDTGLRDIKFESYIENEMLDRFKKKHPDIEPDSKSLAMLKWKSEEAVIQLSTSLDARIIIPDFAPNVDLDESITRPKFEFICDDDVFSHLLDCIDLALEDAGLTPDDITNIVMVGDYCHVPLVKQNLVDYFDGRIKVFRGVNPEHIIAIGASIICNKLSNGFAFTDSIRILKKQ